MIQTFFASLITFERRRSRTFTVVTRSFQTQVRVALQGLVIDSLGIIV